jgi:long-chain fatty acid transport protein
VRHASRLAGAVALATALSLPARAQFESSALAKIQVNVVNPGGKSLAMGGAFVALADDSTAAFANPAGLVQLTAWQAGASVKGFRFSPNFDTRVFAAQAQGAGEAFVQVRSIPFQPTTTVTDVDFASVVAPIVPEKLVLSLYRAVDLRYRYELNEPRRQFQVNLEPGDGAPFAIEEQGSVDIRNEVVGLAAATRLKVGEVPVDLGAGLTFSRLHYEFGGPGGAYLSRIANFSADFTDVSVSAAADSSWRPGFSVGARSTLDEVSRLSVGAVYRRNGSHDVSYSVGAPFDLACGKANDVGFLGCGTMKSPDDFALGVSGAVGNLTGSAEFQRILYSQLNDGFVHLYRYFESNDQGTTYAVPVGSSKDATVIRVGLEYALPIGGSDLLFFRAGYYHETAHGTTLALKKDDLPPLGEPDDGTDKVFTTLPVDQVLKGVYDGGSAQDHVSAGVGASLFRRVSLDLAYDWSEEASSFSASLFVRF